MLELFKRNTFFTILLLIPYALILHSSAWITRNTYQYSQNCWVFNKIFKPNILNYSTETLLAVAFITIQAILIGLMVSKYKMNSDGQLFGGLFFIIFCGFHYTTLNFNPVLIANLFFTIGLYELFGIYLKKSATTQLFNFGFLMGLASLFYTPYYIFLLLGIVGIFILRGSRTKEFFQLIGGFINLYFLVFVILYALNLNGDFWSNQILGFFSLYIFSFKFLNYGWVAFSLIFLFLIVILVQYPYFRFKRTIMVQKQFEILFWSLFICLFSVLFLKIELINHLMILYTPLALLAGLLLTKLKNPLIQETIHLFFLIVSLFLQFQNW